jgi:hypothetical protein
MGVDPLTMAAAATVASSVVGGYGQYQAQQAADAQFRQRQSQGQSMMKTGKDPYQVALQQLLGKQDAPTQLGADQGNINTGGIMGNFNVGQDALMQFLRSNPQNQQEFASSQAFDMLQGLDQRNQNQAVNALNANFGSLGSRFGSGAARQTSDLLANMGAQTGARNAGILQSSFENAANRRLQGMGLELQGAQGLAQQGGQMAQLAAQLGMANQSNQQFNTTFNQGARQQAFQNQMGGIQAGFGMQNANDQYNMGLYSIMSGMQAPSGNGYQAASQGLGDIGQLMMFLPMLKQMGAAPTAQGTIPYNNVGQQFYRPFGGY